MILDREKILFVFLFCFITTCCDPVIFEDCGSKYDLLTVDIEGCKWSLPCYITVGDDIDVELKFVPGFTSLLLDQDVYITLNYVNQRTNVTPELILAPPCDSNNCDCPLSPTSTSVIRSEMIVPENTALNTRGYLRWKVYNERNELVLCYSVMIQTQNLLQKHLRLLFGQSIVDAIDGNATTLDLG